MGGSELLKNPFYRGFGCAGHTDRRYSSAEIRIPAPIIRIQRKADETTKKPAKEDYIKRCGIWLKTLVAYYNENEKDQFRSRKPYSQTEDWIILCWLISENQVSSAKGERVWMEFKLDGNLSKRPLTSLWNRFMSHILPHIDDYKLPTFIQADFDELVHSKRRRNRQKKIQNVTSERRFVAQENQDVIALD